jgi:hypothetical protein
VVGASTTLLISCWICKITRPLAFTRGVTRRITPVSRYSMLLTTGASGSITLTAD